MISKNDYIREWLGVDVWHKKGYTGKRGLTLTAEPIPGGSHAQRTLAVFKEIAPDREVKHRAFTDSRTQAHGFVDYVKECDADCMYMSLSTQGGSKEDEVEKYFNACWPERFSLFLSAGNDGSTQYNHIIEREKCYGVGAVELRWSMQNGSGKPLPGAKMLVIPAGYTSEDDDVDFGGITKVYDKEVGQAFDGTSCAAPVLCGMVALVNDFFIDKTGKPLKHEAMYQFLKDHCYDVTEDGKDKLTGYGAPRLPDPDTIDIWKYQDLTDVKQEEYMIELEVLTTRLIFKKSPKRRTETKYVILHHADGNGSIHDMHNKHMTSNGYGVGYNYYIAKSGQIYRGRDENAEGDHTDGYDDISIGICFEGNFNKDTMSDGQLYAGQWLVYDILKRYPDAKIKAHSDFEDTTCPGDNFPMDKILKKVGRDKIKDIIDDTNDEEGLDMTIAEFIASLSDAQAYQIIEKAQRHAMRLPLPTNWNAKGELQEAIDMGITDGKNPMMFIPRYQAAIMVARAKE